MAGAIDSDLVCTVLELSSVGPQFAMNLKIVLLCSHGHRLLRTDFKCVSVMKKAPGQVGQRDLQMGAVTIERNYSLPKFGDRGPDKIPTTFGQPPV
jgi:hypothetical protein